MPQYELYPGVNGSPKVSAREVVVVHDSLFSKWTARAVVGAHAENRSA